MNINTNVRYIERPPRLQPDLPHGEHAIPDPPEKKTDTGRPLVQILLPLVSIGGYVLMSLFGQGRNLLLMVPMAISVVVSMGISLYSLYQSRRSKGVEEAQYLERLIALRREMTTQHDIQRRFYRHNFPEPGHLLRMAYEAHRRGEDSDKNGRLGTRLWERRRNDADFGALRLGLGSRPSTVVYSLSRNGGVEDAMMRSAKRLAEDSRVLAEVPIDISLFESAGEGNGAGAVQHAVGVVGQSAAGVRTYVSALLVHLAALHAPTDMRLFVLGLQSSRDAWRWMGRLPHCSSERAEEVLCFEDQVDRDGERDHGKVSRFLRGLRSTLDDRQTRLRDEGQGAAIDWPCMLLVVDLLPALPAESALADLESDPCISQILNRGAALGAAVLFLAPDMGRVPGGCRAIIELTSTNNSDGQKENGVGFRYAEVGVNRPRYAGKADLVTNAQALGQFAQYLEALRVRESYGADLPRSVLMQDMLGFRTAEELRQRMLDNWRRSQRPEQAEWLQVALGALPGGDIRGLRFSADADGVHGLIAGSTGSGKSELLMTMILGLAYNYDPSIVNFVLVDFKGGAAFEPFRNLPHCVDIVTNLKGNAVERMFAAIMAEIHRREAINVATGAKHIVHYRQSGLHQPPYGRAVTIKDETLQTAPYPHLFIFIDEFAEMIAENPEYKAQLNSITRLGRALGITLILAAQRPTGVTDQMRANIKFRIALRVETREESSEVLRRPDAAYLPTGIPGRGYLQVGNENIELIQVAWTGSDYDGGVDKKAPDVVWHDRPRNAPANAGEEAPKMFEVMVDTMADLAREVSLPQRKPWPDFLPESMSLQTPVDASYINPEGLNALFDARSPEAAAPDGISPMGMSVYLNRTVNAWLAGDGRWSGLEWDTKAMRAPVGLIDIPHHAEQTPLVVDLRRGHAVVFGASGWGKTTFLRTLITTLAVTHSPQEMHVYILDFGGRQLGVFHDLPHAGAIITPDEEERVTRLLRHLDRLLEERKTLMSNARADDLYSFNRGTAERALPAVLVVIDNFAEFRESFDNLMPTLVSLVRESRAYGIHFVTSADLPGSLGGKLYSLFNERLALKLSDPTEYTGIVGRGAHAIDDIPGRGFVKVGRRALAFQAALPIGEADEWAELDETQRLGQLVRLLRDAARSLAAEGRPASIDTLPMRVLLADLLPAVSPEGSLRPVLGVDDLTLEPWRLDLSGQGPHCLVVGPPNSGKTTTLRSLILSLAYTYSPERVVCVVVDYQKRFMRYGGSRTLMDLPHIVAWVTNNDELAAVIKALEVQCPYLAEDKREIVVVIDNYDTFADEAGALRKALPALGALAREHGTDGLHFVAAGSPGSARSPEELRKQIVMPRLGIALQSEDAVSALHGRIPRSLAQTELPMGRGFLIRSGRTSLLQIATPHGDDEQQALILDRWVTEIKERHPGLDTSWWHFQEPEGEGAEEVVKTADQSEDPERAATGGVPTAKATGAARRDGADGGDNPSRQPPARLRAVPEGVDVEAIMSQLRERGMNDGLLAIMSPVDVVNVARELKIPGLEGNDE